LGVTPDSFYTRDILYQQSIVDAGLSLAPAPLPSAGWLLVAGLACLLTFAKRQGTVDG
jgi:hypothetical protein